MTSAPVDIRSDLGLQIHLFIAIAAFWLRFTCKEDVNRSVFRDLTLTICFDKFH